MAVDPQIKSLARRIAALERGRLQAKQPNLGFSTITDGAIQSVQDNDSLKAIMGMQWDGTQTVSVFNGPTPPTPSNAIATPAIEGAVVRWDGTFAGGAVAPMDFSRVEVHASTDPAFTAEFASTLRASIETPRGAEFFLALPSGSTWYVKLVCRSQAGARSAATANVSVIPQNFSSAVVTAKDGLAPTSSPTPTARGGIGTMFVEWTPITNPDPVTYEIHVSTTDGFTPSTTTLAGQSKGGTLFTVHALPNGTPLDYTTTYYIKIVATDADGPGPASAQTTCTPKQADTPDIATSAITADQIDSNSVTAEKLAAQIALLSELFVGDKIAIRPTESSPGAGDSGIRIDLTNGGYIHFPADGSAAKLVKVDAQLSTTVVEDDLTINGANNKVAGSLIMNNSVPPPSVAPTVTSIYDPSPITTSAAITGQAAGLGNNGTEWEVGQHYSFTKSTGVSVLRVHKVNKTTGVTTLKYSVSTSAWPNEFNWAQADTDPPTPVLTSFHSVGSHAVFSLYRPAWSGNYNDGIHAPVPFSWPAVYEIIVINNSTGAVLYNWQWSTYASWKYPAICTDGTYIWVAATNRSSNSVSIYRYTLSGGSQTTIVSGASGTADFSGMYFGAADYGANKFVVTAQSAGTISVYNGTTGARETVNDFTRSGNETVAGINYDGTRFVSYHTATYKLRKYSTLAASTSRAVKYTWHNIANGTESTASPVATVTQTLRQWLQVVTSSIPTSSDPTAPDSVRIYIAAHRQTDPVAGDTNETYEIPTTSGVDSPATDGFVTLGNAGGIVSEATDADGALVKLAGNGSYRMAPMAAGLSYTTKTLASGFNLVNTGPTLDSGFPKSSSWPNTPSGTLQVPKTGFYYVYGKVSFTAGPTSVAHRRGVGVEVTATAGEAPSGSTVIFQEDNLPNNGSTHLSVSGIIYATKDQYIRLVAYTDSTSGTGSVAGPMYLRALALGLG